jgi:hypothetical protein
MIPPAFVLRTPARQPSLVFRLSCFILSCLSQDGPGLDSALVRQRPAHPISRRTAVTGNSSGDFCRTDLFDRAL